MAVETPDTFHKFLAQQLPYRLLSNNPAFCAWIKNDQANFSEPFFNETISRLRSAKLNQRRYKSVAHINMLPEWAAKTGPAKKPSAIIFHVSRCGSTLFSQLLALQQQYMVLSEVPFFDELLRLPFKDAAVSKEQTSGLFDAALQLYINSSDNVPSHVFIKTDSWHLHFHEQLRMLYPEVPFILLYRNPLEVLRSQQRRRGMQAVPGIIEPAIFGLNPSQVAALDLDEYMAHVLHSYFDQMIAIAGKDPNSLLINYQEGALAGMKKIVSATGIPFDNNYETAIEERAGYHAKYPEQVFAEEQATEETPGFLQPVMQLYDQLEQFRTKAFPA